MWFSRQQKYSFAVVGGIFLALNLAFLYFFGFIQYMNPKKALRSDVESDRFDALVYIANKGSEGTRWQSIVIEALSNDPSPDIREMAVITLRELGKDKESIQALEQCQATENKPSVKQAIQELLVQWQE